MLTVETPKGGRKAANVVIAKANRLLVALLIFIVSIVVRFVKNIYIAVSEASFFTNSLFTRHVPVLDD